MIPILYAANETDFSHCGIGALSEMTSCAVTEERNGAFECEFKYPVDGKLFAEIQESRIVKAKPNEMSDPQLFRIYASSKPINGIVTYRAEHISYELSGYPVESVSVENATARASMNAILNATLIAHRYTAQSDIELLKSTTIDRKSARAALGGVEGSVLSLWGGEFEFDNFTVKLHKARGRKTGIKIAYGKNITDIKQEASVAGVYTAVYPYAKYTTQPTDGQTEPEEITVSLPEKILYSQKASKAAGERVCIKDFSESFDGATEITVEQLRAKAQEWVKTSGFDVPSVNITVAFENLWQSPEYEQYALLERCGLCDTISVEFPALNISTTAKIIKTKYDVLSEKYLQITLGSARANFADTVKDTSAAIEQTKQEIKQSSAKVEVDFKKAIDDATKAITGQSGGYVVLNPAKNPQEILIMDAPTIAAAKCVWRWNSGGLGYSKNGYNGPFETAITQDGAIVADFITVGQIATARLDVQDIINTGRIAVLGDVKVETERATKEEEKLSSSITANATEIAAKVSTTGGTVSSFAWSLTDSGFVLTSKNTEVMKVTSGGLNITGHIVSASGTIGGWTISNTEIYKGTTGINACNEYTGKSLVVAGTSPVRFYAGSNDRINGKFIVLDDGSLYASAARIEGTIYANGGNFSNCTIDETCIIAGTLTANVICNNETNSNDGVSSGNLKYGVYGEDGWASGYVLKTVSPDQAITAKIAIVTTNTSEAETSKFGRISAETTYYDAKTATYKTASIHFGNGNLSAYSNVEVTGKISARTKDQTGKVLLAEWYRGETTACTFYHDFALNQFNIGSMNNSMCLGTDGGSFENYLKGTWMAADGAIINLSDCDAKKAITDLNEQYDHFFDNIRPRLYQFKNGASGRTHIGYIAQEIGCALSQAKISKHDFAPLCIIPQSGKWGLRYEEFVSLNTWQIQKLKAHLREVENRLAMLEKSRRTKQ